MSEQEREEIARAAAAADEARRAAATAAEAMRITRDGAAQTLGRPA